MRIKFLVFLFLSVFCANSQELKAIVSINTDQVTSVNPQIFKNLEKQVFDFLNNTKFSEKVVKQNEKINCSFFFIVTKFESNNFEASLQVNSSRPVYNSTFTTPILNINDKDVSFKYIEFENLIYDQNTFTSNLVSILSFYANVIIASDADTFSDKGGTDSYETALNITNVAELAFIIAHELAHIKKQHALKEITRDKEVIKQEIDKLAKNMEEFADKYGITK
jgi:hypothetical protein